MKLLDLFCGAGGAAMGYHRVGFEVTGIDIKPQRHYLFTFIQADALEYCVAHGHEYDVIHASPPCQHYSKATAWRGNRDSHPDLIAPTRNILLATGKPFVIENVEGARSRLYNPLMICGTALGLPIQRHRYFELSWYPALLVPGCAHRDTDYSFDHGGKQTETIYRDAMGCDWMTVQESRQAIPPAYTEFIGRQLMRAYETHALP